MRFKNKQSPEGGQLREKQWFAWWPVTIDGETRWLETVRAVQKFPTYYTNLGWQNLKFIEPILGNTVTLVKYVDRAENSLTGFEVNKFVPKLNKELVNIDGVPYRAISKTKEVIGNTIYYTVTVEKDPMAAVNFKTNLFFKEG